jgi:hypothetical protein
VPIVKGIGVNVDLARKLAFHCSGEPSVIEQSTREVCLESHRPHYEPAVDGPGISSE